MTADFTPDLFFATEKPSAAGVPHLITHLDSELLHALVGINGAKPGVWPASPAYDETDRYQPFREDLPFTDWALGYNQSELIELAGYCNTLVFSNETLIVDSSAPKSALEKAEEARGDDGYADFPGYPALLKQIGWSLTALGPERNYGLFAVGGDKINYLELLQKWCHQHGRTYLRATLADGKLSLREFPAPPEFRRAAVVEHGLPFVAKLAHLGIGTDELRAHLDALLK